LAGNNAYPSGPGELTLAQPESLAKTSFDPVSTHGFASLPRNKYTVFEAVSRLPDQGKKIGRNAAPVRKQGVYFRPALKAQGTRLLISSDQL
jgi:hypothetical protein